jgi:hypothetical protein
MSNYQTSSMPPSRDKHAPNEDPRNSAEQRAKIRLGRYSMPMPGRRHHRVILGSGLVVGGIFGFLPILGFWMIPLGLVVLSVDSHYVRRSRRKLEVRWGRWRRTKVKPKAAD